MRIRFARKTDAGAMRKIYGQYMNTPVTFEYELPPEEAFVRRIAAISEEYPCLVCENEGTVSGYAYACRHMERAAYRWNAELSVYLDEKIVSKGMGKRLYGILTEISKLQNIKTLYGIVTLPNEKSERLHISSGFGLMCVCRGAGYKCGKWHDVAWFRKEIAPRLPDPEAFLPVNKIPPEKLEALIKGN